MIRVLMIGQMSIVGGQQSFMINYFRHLDKNRFEVDFLGVHGNSSPYSEEIEKLGGRIYYWNETFGFKVLLSSLRKLVNFIKNGKYDVVHSNIYIGNCWFLVAAKLAGVKIRISHSHCTFPLKDASDSWIMGIYHSHIQKFLLLKSSTLLVACGDAAGRALYGNKEFVVLNNSIDLYNYSSADTYAIDSLRKEFQITEDTKVYASISRFDYNKNLVYAVEVFDKIIKNEKNSVLIIGGAEPYDSSTHAEIENIIKEKGIFSKARIVNTRTDLRNIMQIVDCWLFPSFNEGLPIVGIELQAASVPIVASDTITSEMDMGLGLVHYVNLNNINQWVKTAIHVRKVIIPFARRKLFFAKHGYDIYESVKLLEKLYLKND